MRLSERAWDALPRQLSDLEIVLYSVAGMALIMGLSWVGSLLWDIA